MTTNCGSFSPEARATSVAAGIPMRVTTAAATIVAQVRLATGIRELANAHKITVASDPHVPGPGLRRPAPKKVATSVAHSGAARSGAAGSSAISGGGFISLRPRRRDCLAALLPRRQSTGDEITYAPLAHLPRSIKRQRSLQKGKSASAAFAGFLQIGQRSLMVRLRGIVGLQRSEVRLQR